MIANFLLVLLAILLFPLYISAWVVWFIIQNINIMPEYILNIPQFQIFLIMALIKYGISFINRERIDIFYMLEQIKIKDNKETIKY